MASTERDRNAQGRPENARPRDRLGRPLPRGAVNELPEPPEVSSPEEALAVGAGLFDRELFFTAHEVWEQGWHAAHETERDFWQGIIQVAVGFCHHQRGNPKGAAELLTRAARRLGAYGEELHGIPVARLRSAALRAADAVRSGGAEAQIDYPRIGPLGS